MSKEFPLGRAVYFVEMGEVRRGVCLGVIAGKVSLRERGGRVVALDLRRCYASEAEASSARKVGR